jgi:hypothetical protein
MKDWIAIAQAAGLNIPAEDARRIAQPLNGLEEAFRPLVQSLAPDMEPADSFRAEEDAA